MLRSLNLLPFAIPLFIVAILIEVLYTRHHKLHEYEWHDTLTCLSTSILSSLVGLAGAGIITYAYFYLYAHYRLTDMLTYPEWLQTSLWLLLIILQDFIYYWFHRISHRVNFLWAAHIVHHSSEAFNFAVALRQSSFQQFFGWPFYLVLALAGFPPAWFLAVVSINLIYQFWFHTREVERLPDWIEAIFNTPSHHRVHHGVNPLYLDKNYGGVFIIWDKWFGTFEAENEAVRYGITVPVNSYNPLWVNVHHFVYLYATSRLAPDFWQGLRLWLSPPDWKPAWQNQLTASDAHVCEPAASLPDGQAQPLAALHESQTNA